MATVAKHAHVSRQTVSNVLNNRTGYSEETRTRVKDTLAGIAGSRFDPVPGRYCNWCDFLSFCEAGKAFVAANP
jgi:hypothetical protein